MRLPSTISSCEVTGTVTIHTCQTWEFEVVNGDGTGN
jgi:hypothetical protein